MLDGRGGWVVRAMLTMLGFHCSFVQEAKMCRINLVLPRLLTTIMEWSGLLSCCCIEANQSRRVSRTQLVFFWFFKKKGIVETTAPGSYHLRALRD